MAYRLVVDAAVAASSICIFEAEARIGGRIYSLRNQGDQSDLVVDAGGYRTFDTISPRTQYLITNRLNLSLGCYDPISCLGKVIVNGAGHRIGYATFVEAMHDIVVAQGVAQGVQERGTLLAYPPHFARPANSRFSMRCHAKSAA